MKRRLDRHLLIISRLSLQLVALFAFGSFFFFHSNTAHAATDLLDDPFFDELPQDETETPPDAEPQDAEPPTETAVEPATPARGARLTLTAEVGADFSPSSILDPIFSEGMVPFHVDYEVKLDTQVSNLAARQTTNAVAEFDAIISGNVYESGGSLCTSDIAIAATPVSITIRPKNSSSKTPEATGGVPTYHVNLRFGDAIEEAWRTDCPINPEVTLTSGGAPQFILQAVFKTCTPPLSSFELSGTGALEQRITCDYTKTDDGVYDVNAVGSITINLSDQ